MLSHDVECVCRVKSELSLDACYAVACVSRAVSILSCAVSILSCVERSACRRCVQQTHQELKDEFVMKSPSLGVKPQVISKLAKRVHLKILKIVTLLCVV